MKTRIVRIGNSRGVRIPERLLDQARLDGVVELRVMESGILISRPHAPRAGWAEAAAMLAARGEGGLLDESTATDFEVSTWEW